MGSMQKAFHEMSLVERLEAIRSKPALLCDISSSMREDVEPGRTKFEALCDILQSLTGNPAIYAFNHDVQFCPDVDNIPQPMGNTALSPAFRELKARGIKKAIIITDGDVNDYDQEKSLEEVEGLEIKILYVGGGPKPKFLDKLARKANGYCDAEDLKQQKELGTKLQLLLGSGKDSAIQL